MIAATAYPPNARIIASFFFHQVEALRAWSVSRGPCARYAVVSQLATEGQYRLVCEVRIVLDRELCSQCAAATNVLCDHYSAALAQLDQCSIYSSVV